MTAQLLSAFRSGLFVQHVGGDPDPTVISVTADSRQVQPGSLFVAIQGTAHDGHFSIDDAVAAGATTIVVEAHHGPVSGLPSGVSQFQVENGRVALAHWLRRWHLSPDQKLTMVAVTGTNGKTSVAHLSRDLLRALGRRPGLLGTVQYDTGLRQHDAPLTTPGPEQLFPLLAEMVEAGLDACAMEASSHALDQDRLGDLEVDVAAFTNFTRDHLDYHETWEDYFRAKLRLLERTTGDRKKPFGRVVVHGDDATFAHHSWPEDTIFVGRGRGARVRVTSETTDRLQTQLSLTIDGRDVATRSRLIGSFNVDNLLVSVGVGLALGSSTEEILEAIPYLSPVRGRLEPMDLEDGPLCVIDYAHTPDGIRSALQACRTLTNGRLGLVFGCGGDRDRGKRPLMAKMASEFADHVVLTQDNPRGENLSTIFADTEVGFVAGSSHVTIEDREEAIAAALRWATPDDLVLVAGKGHEDYQIVAGRKIPWSDREAIRRAWGSSRAES